MMHGTANAWRRKLACAVMLLLLWVLPAALPAFAQSAPQVRKVEPPNWWVGLPDPMVLVAGENLSGVRVTASDPEVRVKQIRESQGGHYLFVWLNLGPSVRPQPLTLTLSSPTGSVTVEFPLRPRHDQAGSFQGFSQDDVLYLIMPDRFADGDPSNDRPAQSPGTYDRSLPRAYHGGDLKGIAEHLDYLKQLGVTTVWLTPIVDNDNRSPADYHGYGAVDLYAVEEHFGTLADYQHLVQETHLRGMKVLFDAVPNHVGPRHIWTSDPPTATWLHGTKAQHLRAQADFPAIVDPHAAPREWRSTVEGWFADWLPDLDQRDPLVSQYLIQNTMWWIESAQLDGLRLDTFPFVNLPFWRDFHAALHTAYPRLKTVGEIWHPDPSVVAYFAGEAAHQGVDTGLDTPFDFPVYFALRDVTLRGASAEKLVEVLRWDWLYPHPERLVTFLGNHDTKRFMSEEGASPEKLKLAFGLLLTLRGTPQIYSGDEIGMQGGEDPDNRRDFPGGFPNDPANAFTAAGRTPVQQGIFSHVQALLRLRQEHVALRRGQQWHIGWGAGFYAYARVTAGERVLVIANTSGKAQTLTLPLSDTPLADARALEPLSAGPAAASIRNAQVEATVPATSVAIFLVK